MATTTSPPKRSKLPSLIAGLSGGVVSTILLYPLDLVKTRLQVNESNPGSLRGLKDKNQRRNRLTTLRTLRGVIKHEGLIGIYQGLTPAVAGSAISWGGYFFLYDGIKSEWAAHKRRKQLDGGLGPSETFIAACASGAVMVLLTNPLWLIKTRMQLQMKQTAMNESKQHHVKKPYLNIVDAARTIVVEEGFMGLYKGAVPALMLVSHGGVQFVAYEFLKERFHVTTDNRRNQSAEYTPVLERFHKSLGYLTMGAVSKMIATTLTYPIQVIKARLQQRSEFIELTMSGNVKVVRRQYKGIADVVLRVWQKEGFFGFFKGSIPNAIRVAPGAAITFVTYETVMDLL